MQYLIIGLDGGDTDALKRRLKFRKAHMKMGDKLLASGNMWYGAALQDEKGKMIGSSLFMDFESEEKLQEWLEKEPYVVGKVWESVTIHRCNTREPWQFNKSEEWFRNRGKEDRS